VQPALGTCKDIRLANETAPWHVTRKPGTPCVHCGGGPNDDTAATDIHIACGRATGYHNDLTMPSSYDGGKDNPPNTGQWGQWVICPPGMAASGVQVGCVL